MTVLNHDLRIADGAILLVDKPKGWTSFDVVNRIRHLFRVKKVGHAGTLDPMATGLLVVCTGKKTKDISAFVGMEKEYEAEMTLGGRTASFDAETPVLETRSTAGITDERVREVLAHFTGRQLQVAPMWSAVKVGGTRLYKLARKGEEVERTPREIEVKSMRPTAIEMPRVRFTVVCSKGTYIRGLASDMGEALGCGAYLTALVRTRIGEFLLADAVTVDDLAAFKYMQGTSPA